MFNMDYKKDINRKHLKNIDFGSISTLYIHNWFVKAQI